MNAKRCLKRGILRSKETKINLKKKTTNNWIERSVRNVRRSTLTFVNNCVRIGRFQHGQSWFRIDLAVQRNNCNQKWGIRQSAQRTLLVHHIFALILPNLDETKCQFIVSTGPRVFRFKTVDLPDWTDADVALSSSHAYFFGSKLSPKLCLQKKKISLISILYQLVCLSMWRCVPFCSLSMAPLERCRPVLWPLFVCFRTPARWTWWSTPISVVSIGF